MTKIDMMTNQLVNAPFARQFLQRPHKAVNAHGAQAIESTNFFTENYIYTVSPACFCFRSPPCKIQ
jgi:hypothetical protein